MNLDKWILLVEDNPDDEELTRRAFRKNNILNRLEVVRDGAEALDYLLGNGDTAGLPLKNLPTVITPNQLFLAKAFKYSRIRFAFVPVSLIPTLDTERTSTMERYPAGVTRITMSSLNPNQKVESVASILPSPGTEAMMSHPMV